MHQSNQDLAHCNDFVYEHGRIMTMGASRLFFRGPFFFADLMLTLVAANVFSEDAIYQEAPEL